MIHKSFYVQKKAGNLSFHANHEHGGRNQAMMGLIKSVDRQFDFADFDRTLILTDGWLDSLKEDTIRKQVNDPKLSILSFSRDIEQLSYAKLLPDDQFDAVSLTSYAKEIEQAGQQIFQKEKICWIGQKFHHQIEGKPNPREKIIQLSREKPKIIAAYSTNANRNPNKPNTFLSIKKQASQWKYLLDIEGYGYSRELKFLLFSGRVVFIQERPWKEWFHQYLKPYEHYIPVKRDLSNLIQQYEWIEKHPDQYQTIASQALQFAKQHLTKSQAFHQIKKVFSKLSRDSIINKQETPLTPYHHLPKSKFWKAAVTNTRVEELNYLCTPKFPINSSTKIVTAGSCFAQHIARKLKSLNYVVLDAEPAPQGMKMKDAQNFGFNLFSARYGNIYTIRQLLQMYDEALGNYSPKNSIWEKKGKYYDALRPRVEPYGLNTKDFVRRQRNQHLKCVLKVFHEADIFVFTLGLTEAWEDIKSGTIYPLAPGTIAGQFDSNETQFKNFDYAEMVEDFMKFRQLLKGNNSNIRFLLTVSPVHLVATASEQHILPASTYSKSVLRAVAGYLSSTLEDVDYFPSYEIITNPAAKSKFYKPNYRGVTSEGVQHVMEHFLHCYDSNYIKGKSSSNKNLLRAKDLSIPSKEKEYNNEICDLALLELFEPEIEIIKNKPDNRKRVKSKPVQLKDFLHQLNKPPIIIGGSRRSGSIQLLNILSYHPEVLAINNVRAPFKLIGKKKKHESLSFNIEKIYSQLHKHSLSPRSNRWIEYSSENLYSFHHLLKEHKEIKLIQIVRDGRDVMLVQTKEDEFESEVSLANWIKDIEIGLDFLYHPNVFTLRYEELILNYDYTIKLLCNFLELPFQELILANQQNKTKFKTYLKNLEDHSIGLWRKNESDVSVQQLLKSKRAIELLKKFDYSI